MPLPQPMWRTFAPSLRIKFDRCEVELVIECETVGEILLLRHSDIAIEATVKDQKRTFVLPEQQNDLHTIIFGTENVDILKSNCQLYLIHRVEKRLTKLILSL